MFKRIVVPLDGSDLAEQALPAAAQLAELARVPLHLVRVVDVTRLEGLGPYGLALQYGDAGEVLAVAEEAARTYLDEQRRRLEEREVGATAEARRGDAGRELVALVGEDDLIVMASHGRSGLNPWWLGSVADHVARHAAAPVLLVHPGRATPGADRSSAAEGAAETGAGNAA